MAFPHKFKALIELAPDQVDRPDYAWINYAVCAVESDSCGWTGWILDGVFQNSANHKHLLHFAETYKCPRCGKPIFRTDINYKMVNSLDQSVKFPDNIDYETVPIEYDDSTGQTDSTDNTNAS